MFGVPSHYKIDEDSQTRSLPKLLKYPTSFINYHPSLVMPKLTPIPKELAIKTFDFCDKNRHESESPVPYESRESHVYNISNVDLEQFLRISNNIGVRFHSNGKVTLKCYANTCNLEIQSKTNFLRHIRNHIDWTEDKNNYCLLCKSILSTDNIITEFKHILNFHLCDTKDSYEAESDISSDDNMEMTTNIKQEEEVDGDNDCVEYGMRPSVDCSSNLKRKIKEEKEENGYTVEVVCKKVNLPEYTSNQGTTRIKESHDHSSNKSDSPSSKRTKLSSLRIASIESQDEIILDPCAEDCMASSSNKIVILEHPEKKKKLFEPKPFVDIFDPKNRGSLEIFQEIQTNAETSQNKMENVKSMTHKFVISSPKSHANNSPKVNTVSERTTVVPTSPIPTSSSFKYSLPKSPLVSQTRPNSQNIVTVRNCDLMCWITDYKKLRSNMKYQIAYKNMLNKNSLIALYKCMGKKCSYTTDNPREFVIHMNHHEQKLFRQREWIEKMFKLDIANAKSDAEKESLKAKRNQEINKYGDYFHYCAYCHYKGKELVHHINDVHRKDVYQCGFCFFRTCVSQTCLEHFRKSHSNKNLIMIYKCPGQRELDIVKSKAMPRLKRKQRENVVALRCKS